MVSHSWRKKNLLKYIVNSAPLLQILAEKYSLPPSRCHPPVSELCQVLSQMIHLRELRLCELLSPLSAFADALAKTDFLRNLHGLRFLSLSGFRGPTFELMASLEELPNLGVLDMTNIWQNVTISSKLTKLHTLWLSSSHLQPSTIQSIKNLPSLTKLDLSMTDMSSSALQMLGQSTSLKSLDLSFSKFKPSGLQHLTGLTSLTIDGMSRVTTDHLTMLTNLRKLEARLNTRLSNITTLKELLPDLTVIT
jgi:hypothetical protein